MNANLYALIEAHFPREREVPCILVADGPVDASQQAVLFYCWTPDVRALEAELRGAGVDVGEITYPFYMPAGELRVHDPDGYVVLVGQLGPG